MPPSTSAVACELREGSRWPGRSMRVRGHSGPGVALQIERVEGSAGVDSVSGQESLLADAERTASYFLMGMRSPEQVIRWAAAAIDADSSPVLVELASTTEAREAEVRQVLSRLVVDLGGAPIDDPRAALTITRETARKITDGTLAPYEGAELLWWKVAHRAPEIEPLLRGFIGLASEWEDDPVGRPRCEREIRDLAQALLEDLSAS